MKDKLDLLLIKTHGVHVVWVPMGLMYVAAGAEKSGARVGIIDLSLEADHKKSLEAVLARSRPALVGITGMYEEFESTKVVAAIVRHNLPDVKIVVGGPMGVSLTGECLADKNIDIVALKEGESVIQDLLRYVKGEMQLPQIRGIAYRGNDEISFSAPRPPEDINAIPIPAWHLIDPARYIESKDNWFGIEHLKVLHMSTSRGCPYSCIYCDKNVFGQKWRGRDSGNIVDEMIMLRDTYGANAVMFSDDIFDVNKIWVFSLIDEMQARGVHMYWGCNSRVNHADYELYKRMHDAGCCYIGLGIEFGSDEMLEKVHKQATVAQAYKALDIAKAAGLRTVGYLMMGMLDETSGQIEETIKFALKSKIYTSGVSLVTPIAGTPLYEMAVKAGRLDPGAPWWKTTRANAYINLSKNVSHKRLAYLASKAYWMLFWSRPGRKWPRWACRLMQQSFYIFAPFVGDRFVKFINRLDTWRRKLRLGLP